MRALLILFFATLFSLQLGAQDPKQTVRGIIIDEYTEEALAGASVQILSANGLGAITDTSGQFKILDVPVGRHVILVQYAGYVDVTIRDEWVRSGKETVLRVGMEEGIKLKEVVIEGEVKSGIPVEGVPPVHGRLFSAEETRRYAAALDDPGRMASNFAGVQPSSDGRNDIVIRGNSPAGLLWRLEGVDIPNPNHFANPGSSGGGIAILSSHMLDNSNFLTGAFPSKYGNALSGVFDLRLRRGNNQQREFSARVGALGLDIAAEGPFSKKKQGASFLANYRYSTLGLMTYLDLPVLNGAVSAYQDLAFNIELPTEKAGKFTVFGIAGTSFLRNRAERDTTLWETASDGRDETFSSEMAAFGITHRLLLPNNKTVLRSLAAATFNQTGDRSDTLSADFDAFNIFAQKFLQGRVSASLTLSHKFSARHFLDVGTFAHILFFNLKFDRYNFGTQATETEINSSGQSVLLQPFVSYRYRITEKLSLNAGLHAVYLDLNSSFSFEPRATITYETGEKHYLGLAYGLHSQVLPLGTYFAEHPDAQGNIAQPNRDLGFTKSHHFVLSYNVLPTSDIRIKPELYYQALYNVPVGTIQNPGLSTLNTNWGFEIDSLFNDGTGANYGVEITIEKFFTRNYYFLITGSLYESQYSGRDGIQRNTRYNGNYAGNIIAGKEFHYKAKRPQHIEFSGRTIVLGGQWTTPIDLDASRQAKRTVLDAQNPFSIRQKPYFRSDFRIAWHLEGRRTSHSLSFDAQNAFNTKNDFVQFYDPEKDAISQFYQAGFVPIVSYRINF